MCEPECAFKAIYMGVDFYEINPANCTQCVGHFDVPQCKEGCSVDVGEMAAVTKAKAAA